MEKRLALIALILVAGLVGAFLFPRAGSAPTVVNEQEEPGVVQFRDDAKPVEDAPSTVLRPVEATELAPTTAARDLNSPPTISTRGALDPLAPAEDSLAHVPPTLPPRHDPQLPALPVLTDEPFLDGQPLTGEIGQPPASDGHEDAAAPAELADVPLDAADELTPIPDGLLAIEPSPAPLANQAVQKPLRVHVVRDGDTLEKLARRYLGDASRSYEIFSLNHETLTTPEILPLGAKIKLPPRDAVKAAVPGVSPAVEPPTLGNEQGAGTRGPLRGVGYRYGERIGNPLRDDRLPLVPIRP